MPGATAPPSLGLVGKIAVAASIVALVATAAYVRLTDSGRLVTSTGCEGAVGHAASLASLATGAAALFRPAVVSQDLRGLAFADAADRRTTLGAFDGRTVLVNFWATWCAPCRAEMPALDNLQAARGGDDFAVVAVSLDSDATAESEAAFLAEVGATHLSPYRDPNLRLTAELKHLGLVWALPTTILVDPSGCRLGTVDGGMNWASQEALALIEAAVGG